MKTQLELYNDGIARASAFLAHNGIRPPMIKRSTSIRSTGDYVATRGGVIRINVERSAVPAVNPGGYRWSYPGYKIDRTPYGVVAHETGHHVDATLGYPSRRLPRDWYQKRVSGYEPNNAESFAESMKLFITNPDLLRVGAPVRYAFMRTLGLSALDASPWRDVLAGNARLIAAATNWINK